MVRTNLGDVVVFIRLGAQAHVAVERFAPSRRPQLLAERMKEHVSMRGTLLSN